MNELKKHLIAKESGKYTYLIGKETIVIRNVGTNFMIETFRTSREGELFLVDSYGYAGQTLKACRAMLMIDLNN
jgi:hypothetical protein